MTDLAALTLTQAARAIRARECSSVDLLNAVLARIDEFEPKVLAWLRLDVGGAQSAAKQLEAEARAGTWRGPLHGVPVGIKDLCYTLGLETNANSTILDGFVPEYDATAVRRLREAGAIILGKTALTAFAAMDPALTRNPWNLAHTPGGSSSGSAAALAARMCYGALGTQTAGSIVRPAAYCGVVGLKPTYGRVSRYGVVRGAWSMDHVGPMARTVEDVAQMLEVIAGSDDADPTAARRPVPRYTQALKHDVPLTIGVPECYSFQDINPEVQAAYDAALRTLEDCGMRLAPVRLPESLEAGVDAGVVIMFAEYGAFHQGWFRARRRDYPPKLTALLDAGLSVSAAAYLRAQQVRRVAAEGLEALFDTIDVLATPATPTPPPHGLAFTGHWRLNMPFSVTGHPALSVPMGFSATKLPLGLQLAARYFGEESLLAAAARYEAATDWHRQSPAF